MSDAVECPECGGSGVRSVPFYDTTRLIACDHVTERVRSDAEKLGMVRYALDRLLSEIGSCAKPWCLEGDCAACDAERVLDATR